MAAERAAALTEAYRILSNEERRAEYDRSRAAVAQTMPGAPPAASASQPPDAPAAAGAPASAATPSPSAPSSQFHQERATRDAFVRKATMGRFRQAIDATLGDYEHQQVAGFDIACAPRSKLFARGKGPRLLVRFVPAVDGRAVAETWSRAGQWSG